MERLVELQRHGQVLKVIIVWMQSHVSPHLCNLKGKTWWLRREQEDRVLLWAWGARSSGEGVVNLLLAATEAVVVMPTMQKPMNPLGKSEVALAVIAQQTPSFFCPQTILNSKLAWPSSFGGAP